MVSFADCQKPHTSSPATSIIFASVTRRTGTRTPGNTSARGNRRGLEILPESWLIRLPRAHQRKPDHYGLVPPLVADLGV